MAEGALLKVALLARAGDAREQLKRAIIELGAELVVEADPNELAPGALASAGATAVLVSVEPAVEAALDRLDGELLAPALNVMYDEAETTSKLQGWDQARWARHLAAKLLGRDVLPPGAEPQEHQEAAEHLVPGAPSAPASFVTAERIAEFANEASTSALDVPIAYRPGEALPAAPAATVVAVPVPAPWAASPTAEGDPVALDLDLAALEQAMVTADTAAPVEEEMIDLRGLELVDDLDEPEAPRPSGPSVSLVGARELDLGGLPGAEPSGMDVEELTLTEAELIAFGDSAVFATRTRVVEADASALDGDEVAMDPELAKLAASFDENLDALTFEPASDDFSAEFDLADGGSEASGRPAPVAAENPAPAARPDTSGLSLADDDVPLAVAPAPSRRDFDFSALGGLELAPMDNAPAAPRSPVEGVAATATVDVGHFSLSPLSDEDAGTVEAAGTVLVLSGIGGPDAVRQLVRALPAGFPRSVLLHQNLDGGRHDRFVEQLAKISRLPVALASSNETPPANAVRVLTEGQQAAGALQFPRDGGIAALIVAAMAKDGAVVVLSGVDESAIGPLKQALANGIRILVQDPASCFDGKVAAALRDAGAASMPASDLAARLDAYFPT